VPAGPAAAHDGDDDGERREGAAAAGAARAVARLALRRAREVSRRTGVRGVMIETPRTGRAETREPEVAPPIPRSVDRASRRGPVRAQVAPIEPSGRQWTRGHCTPKLKLAGMIARLQRLHEKCDESSPGQLDEIGPRLEARALAPVADSHLGSCCCIKPVVQRLCLFSSVTEAEHHSHHIGPKSAVAARRQTRK
jgi:hypothetical protein